jgi:serine/threonine protein kinase
MVTTNGTVQLIDFGLSRIVGVNNFATLTIRNSRYSAPELMPVTEYAHGMIVSPTYQTDVFSFSMTMLEVRSDFHLLSTFLDDANVLVPRYLTHPLPSRDLGPYRTITSLVAIMISFFRRSLTSGLGHSESIMTPSRTSIGVYCAGAGVIYRKTARVWSEFWNVYNHLIANYFAREPESWTWTDIILVLSIYIVLL